MEAMRGARGVSHSYSLRISVHVGTYVCEHQKYFGLERRVCLVIVSDFVCFSE
jgi:hypothetical protein